MVRKYIQEKRESERIFRRKAEEARAFEEGRGDDGRSSPRSILISRSGSSELRTHPNPLVLHDKVFTVSLARSSVDDLRQWIVQAAAGQNCPAEFNFPAVDQTISNAWIDAYEAMDVVKEKKPCVMWGEAVSAFESRMGGGLKDSRDASKVLLRAMQHREAEGGVLLSLADASAPVPYDMIHLDPAWLIELVRRLADHNLVDRDEKKQGTIEQELRQYARRHHLDVGPLIETHRWVGSRARDGWCT